MPEQQTPRGLWGCPHTCTAPCALECDAAPLKTEAGECARACPCGCHDDRVTWADRDLIGCACGALHWPEETAAAGFQAGCEEPERARIQNYATGVWMALDMVAARRDRPLDRPFCAIAHKESNAGSQVGKKGGCICPRCGATLDDDLSGWPLLVPHDEGDSRLQWCEFCACFWPNPSDLAECESREVA